MRVTIHTSLFSPDSKTGRGADARAYRDAPHIQAQLLSAGLDAEIVDGPVAEAPESEFWFVFEHDIPWHLASSSSATRERFVVLRPDGSRPFSLGAEAAAVTYDGVDSWAVWPTPDALAVHSTRVVDGSTLAAQLVGYLRAIAPAQASPALRGPFPVGETCDRGTIVIERKLQGEVQKLFLGRNTRSGGTVLIAVDTLPTRIDVRAFEQSVAYESPGVLALAYVGKVDFCPGIDLSEATSTWVLVETAPDGDWLPFILGRFEPDVVLEPESRPLPTHDPTTALRDALSLGRSAGRILATAFANGLVLARVRPEYMWAARVNGALEVTGLTARGDAMFAQSRADAPYLPIFDRYYYAPEVMRADVATDDRALVFALSIMVAEWATGRYPYKYKFHDAGRWAGKHLKLTLPKPLAATLSRGMSVDRDRRPFLKDFLAELEIVSAFNRGDD